MSRLRCLVRKSLCSCEEKLQSRKSDMFFLFSDDASFVIVKWNIFFQIFINYDFLSNNRLLRFYDFVSSSNFNDNYDIVLSTHSTISFWKQKQKLWRSTELDSICIIFFTLIDSLSKNVLRYFRIQRLNESNLFVIQVNVTDETINVSNEMKVLQFLVNSFCDLLKSFEIQLKILEKQLAMSVHSSKENAWIATHVNLSEQRMLKLTRKRTKNLLAIAKNEREKRKNMSTLTRCAYCDEIFEFESFMLCERCRTMNYCTRTCQIAHYKEHKIVCRVINTVSKNDSKMK